MTTESYKIWTENDYKDTENNFEETENDSKQM